ncbi:ABC transporter permease [Anaerocolumna sedimenticola]|uniref:ABC transporter permease n=1 Tax=Anaerocolumna sedimenticola TaxID=2696063 RepID=A0A6P1TI17_9FIRM|nr:ABC transporter permease [Anaerocolumna sedimenticola]
MRQRLETRRKEEVEKIKNNALVKKIGFNKLVLCFVLILMYFAFAIVSPTFISYSRILSALSYAYFLGFLALGVTFVIGTGGIDFSIGPVMFCAALVSGQLLTKSGWPLIPCLIVSILVALLFGALNGYMVAYFRIPPFITSMAIMQISKGVGSVFTKTQSVSWPQASEANGWYRYLVKANIGGVDVPTGLIFLGITAVICAIILNKTKIGRNILCIGSNREAVRLSGVNVKKWEMMAYMICGVLVGIAAIFFVGAYTTIQPGLGDQYNNEAIAAAVMGGTSMAGGIASIGGTFIGTMIIALLQEGILAMGFTKDYQLVITGIIVIIAVYMDAMSKRRRN